MIQEIKSINDVKIFFRELLEEGLNFHPDESFENYVNVKTRLATYTSEDAEKRSRLLDEAFNVCKKSRTDIYELCMEVFTKDFWLSSTT